ncbi:MAG: O-antigen ligase family protein, partial [Acidobacteriaceae bacterium]
IFQYFSLMALPMRFWGGGGLERIVSVFEYPNALALYLGPAIALFIVLAIKNEWLFSKFWFGIGLALQILALIMTFSRGAWAAVAVVVFFSLFLRFKPKKLVAATAIILIVFLLVPIIRNRLVETVNDPSGLARADLLKAGLSEVSKQPILGNGLYGFRTTLTDRNFQGEILNYPHNIILNFWLETGLLGLLSFLFIVFVSMKGQRGRIYGMAGIAFLCVVLIHGLVDVPYFKNDLSLLFWSVAAMLNAKN